MARELTAEQQKAIQDKLSKMSPGELQEMIRQQCVFCKIVAGEIPCYKVYEDSKLLAFLDINPANPGHILVVPKTHFTVLPQMPDKDIAHLFSVVKSLAGIVFEVLQAEGVNVLQNNGEIAGQAVPHVHVHIIPRFQKDKLKFTWEARKLKEQEFTAIQKAVVAVAKKIKVSAPAKKETKTTTKAPKTKSKRTSKTRLYRFPRIP